MHEFLLQITFRTVCIFLRMDVQLLPAILLLVGFGIPMPPSLVGRAERTLSMSVILALPVIAGIR